VKRKRNKEILKEIRKITTRAAVIRVLYSSNINVTVLDKTVKDRAYRLLLIDELRIFKKNYLVGMLEILLSI
jgi:hypothetical protein